MIKEKKSDLYLKYSLKINGESVLLVGNWGYRNLGDELILLGNIKLLLNQGKKITVVTYDPERQKRFFSQFFDVNQISFIPEIPKGFRSAIKYIFKYGLKGLFEFFKCDSLILGGGEILTEENPGSYWYWNVSIFPFLCKKYFQNLLKKEKKSDLYIMGGIQIPLGKNKKNKLFSLLNNSTACYLRDEDAVEEISSYVKVCEFFMDTSYFAYDWNNVEKIEQKKYEKPYIVVNLNKNAENFFNDMVTDIKQYSEKGYKIFYVPIAKGNNTYYQDMQYANRLEKKLGKNVDFGILDWESNFDNFVKILKGSEKVFSSRLHLYLISSFLGCDTKVYPYQRKILKMQKIIRKLF